MDQIAEEIGRFIGDGIYDQEPVYMGVEAHSPGSGVIIPPRKNAMLSCRADSAPTQRDEHLAAIERDGVFAWKLSSGDYAQSRAENSLFAFQTDIRRWLTGEA